MRGSVLILDGIEPDRHPQHVDNKVTVPTIGGPIEGAGKLEVGGGEATVSPGENAERLAAKSAKPPRGFAAMDRRLVSEIARKGGKAAHAAGTAHEFTTDEARVAGRKGGAASHAKRRASQS
jgi:general stress protein YciG